MRKQYCVHVLRYVKKGLDVLDAKLLHCYGRPYILKKEVCNENGFVDD